MPTERIYCDNKLTFEECEMMILKNAVDNAHEQAGKQMVQTPEVKRAISILEDFLREKQLVCYGGQSINEELPENKRFYNKEIDMPDYDFYSPHALRHAKELADKYAKKGYTNVEAKSGTHHGTFKVFVDYTGIADITYIPQKIFNALKQDAIVINGIHYAPPNFLKMGMYLELSRPMGDHSRFTKVFERLTLLNKQYPITTTNCHDKAGYIRGMSIKDERLVRKIYNVVRYRLVEMGAVFFGGYAIQLYSRYMPYHIKNKFHKSPDFDVLLIDAGEKVKELKQSLTDAKIEDVSIVFHRAIGEIIPKHYEIKVGEDTVAFVYEPIACHSYNEIKIEKKMVKVATIDTMLSFYLAFLYTDVPYYNEFADRILCMAHFLFKVQQQNRLKQNGLLKRFSISCYGKQSTLKDIRAEKNEKYQELKDKKGDEVFEKWFLNYKPKAKAKPNTNETPTSQSSKRTSNTSSLTKGTQSVSISKSSSTKTRKTQRRYSSKKKSAMLKKKDGDDEPASNTDDPTATNDDLDPKKKKRKTKRNKRRILSKIMGFWK
jgi:hypothetical protein